MTGRGARNERGEGEGDKGGGIEDVGERERERTWDRKKIARGERVGSWRGERVGERVGSWRGAARGAEGRNGESLRECVCV